MIRLFREHLKGSYIFRLAVRIAREIHCPISEVLEYPSTELNYWAIVFQEEYSDSETITAETSDYDGEIKKFKRIMK